MFILKMPAGTAGSQEDLYYKTGEGWVSLEEATHYTPAEAGALDMTGFELTLWVKVS